MSKETKFTPPKPKPKPIMGPANGQAKKKSNTKHMGVSKGGAVVVRGNGDYYTEKVKPFLQQHVPSGSLSKIGAMLGAHLGGPAGSAIGGYGGGRLAKLLGYGDYSVSSNSLAKPSGALPMGEEIPKFATAGRGTRVVHREYVADITALSSGFINQSFSLNPLNAALFPWGSTLAQQYQQYKFNGLVFEFKTMSTDYSAATSLGTVIMTTNYNANQAAFDNKVEMENTEFAVSAKPSLSQVHCIECDPKERVTEYLFVQPTEAGLLGTNDARLTSFGNFQIATNGVTTTSSTAVIGELWVSYDITFLKPVLNTVSNTFISNTFTNSAVTGNVLFPPATTVTQTTAQRAALIVDIAPYNTIEFPLVGTYMLYIVMTGSGISSGVPPITYGVASATVANLSITAVNPTYNAMIVVNTTARGARLAFNTVSGVTVSTFELKLYRSDNKNSSF